MNGSRYDSETSHFRVCDGHKKIIPPFYRCLFHNVSLQEKVFQGPSASRDVVVACLTSTENWLQSLPLFLEAWLQHGCCFPIQDLQPSKAFAVFEGKSFRGRVNVTV